MVCCLFLDFFSLFYFVGVLLCFILWGVFFVVFVEFFGREVCGCVEFFCIFGVGSLLFFV